MLDSLHRFSEDPEWGELLSRFRVGNITKEDMEKLNERNLGKNSLKLPDDEESLKNTGYACPFNRQRNAVESALFKTHLERTHTHYTDSKTDPPDHTIVIESVLMTKSKQKYSECFHNFIFNSIGDAGVETSYNTHYDPELRLHTGCPLMVNNNTELDTLNIGNGTLCRFVGVKIKQRKTSYVKRINNRKVNAISVINSFHI